MLHLPLGRRLMAGPTLRLGSGGDEVRRLQELLRARGYRVAADGYFGASTYGALLSLQHREGLPADGVADPATWRALGAIRPTMAETSQASPDEPAEWNFMVYMAGNNNLSDAAGRDLEELRAVPEFNGVRVTAFVKQQDSGGRARHMEIGAGGSPDLIEELPPPVDSGDPLTLLRFVRWAVAHAPARRYALVIWNHGGGWTPDDLDQLYTQVRGRTVRHDAENGYIRRTPRMTAEEEPAFSELARLTETPEITKALFTTSLGEVLKLPGGQDRAIASDDGTLHSLDTIELSNVMRRIHDDLGRPIDLLGMDACLMSNLEVCYEIREHVGTVVGSEELEPNEGWPYTPILSAMAANPRMDGRELGRIIVDEYVRSFRGTRQTVTQCAVDATRIEEFMREFETLAAGLRQQVRGNRSVVDSVQSVVTRFHVDRSLVDLRTLCLALVVDSRTDPTLASVADKLLAMHGPGGFVIQEGHQGDKVEGCGGLSAYFPMERTISRYYADLQLAKHTEWDEFLREYGDARTIRR
ncbi:peptidoglycan-binding protein [Nonomuraea sp. K274]|uniref:Peptidoglycan-binding protein n=1 Tax=Nonomuraea cypriaca TaxID=1187855 RepID=A0A931A7W4_9ACTN|nr:clostripain-related cysteine peptidase [Nonomuraea cypriaca]MBF8186645.1 peptidoglycan-binding protein [Nonomuraea cypriaca]